MAALCSDSLGLRHECLPLPLFHVNTLGEENHNSEFKATEAFLLKRKKIQPGIFRHVTSEVDITYRILRKGARERENMFSTRFPTNQLP